MERISVLINSCDKYEDAWKPFFYFFKKNWDCPYQVYLNTETKKCNEDGVVTLNSKVNISWSERLKLSLKKIKSEFIIFFLEDFFLLDSVDQKEIDHAIQIMDGNKHIAVIDFEHCDRCKSYPSKYNGYNVRDLSSMYFLNCQTAIWRRKDLIKFLSPYENPWQFEIYGSERAKLYNKYFLISGANCVLPFLYKFNLVSGYGLYRGKWLKSNVQLFKNNDLTVEFDSLGFYDGANVDNSCPVPKKCFKDRWMYLMYGGGDKPRMSIIEQLVFAFIHPIKNITVLKKKLKYFFTQYRDL